MLGLRPVAAIPAGHALAGPERARKARLSLPDPPAVVEITAFAERLSARPGAAER